MNSQKLAVWGGVALSLSLFSGCAKPIIQPIKNDRIEKNSLYVNSFENISNTQSGYSFQVNNYQPYGYNTRTYTKKMSSILFADAPNNKYELNECKNNFPSVLVQNILITPFVLGLNILSGGICTHRHSFDYEEFDEDAKAWIEDNNINRKLLINTYDSLISTQQEKESLYKNYSAKQTSLLNNLYTQYSKEYAKRPIVKYRTIDLSSLYKEEALTSKVTFVPNRLDREEINTPVSYQNQVNSAFPCKSTTECSTNMKNSIQSIVEKSADDMTALQSTSISTIAAYEKTLQKQTETLTVEYPKDIREDTFKDKTVFYKLLSKNSINSKAKKLDVTYEIMYMKYKNVFPLYENKNSELSIIFNPETKVLVYENLTDKYIQINSINLYYNNNIYNITDNQQRNYATELPPEAFKSLNVINNILTKIKESTYENITKEQAIATKIKFGFSVKYTVGDSSKNKTLYRRDKMNLYSLIKNK